jgi:hypothetical protein
MSTAPLVVPAPDYLDAIEATLARVLRETKLAEPRIQDADRALRLLDNFVATFAGYATGAIARHLCSGMRRWFGDDGLATMRNALRSWPREQVPPAITHACDGDRPLASEARARLHVRFAGVHAHAHELIEAMPDTPHTRMMFGLLAKDEMLGELLAKELALGWRVFVAAVTRTPYPPLDELWQQWVWLLDGRPMRARDAVTEAGYITLVS